MNVNKRNTWSTRILQFCMTQAIVLLVCGLLAADAYGYTTATPTQDVATDKSMVQVNDNASTSPVGDTWQPDTNTYVVGVKLRVARRKDAYIPSGSFTVYLAQDGGSTNLTTASTLTSKSFDVDDITSDIAYGATDPYTDIAFTEFLFDEAILVSTANTYWVAIDATGMTGHLYLYVSTTSGNFWQGSASASGEVSYNVLGNAGGTGDAPPTAGTLSCSSTSTWNVFDVNTAIPASAIDCDVAGWADDGGTTNYQFATLSNNCTGGANPVTLDANTGIVAGNIPPAPTNGCLLKVYL